MQIARQIRKSVFGGRNTKFASGLDFQDVGAAAQTEVDSPPPEKVVNKIPNYIERNKTERARTQGLMRTGSLLKNEHGRRANPLQLSRMQQLNIWMVNEGYVIGHGPLSLPAPVLILRPDPDGFSLGCLFYYMCLCLPLVWPTMASKTICHKPGEPSTLLSP